MTYILLGHFGDQIAILPLLKDECDQGKRPQIMVSAKYATLFDGVSYCDVIPFTGEPWELSRAMALAQTISNEVRCLQIAGPPEQVQQSTYGPAGMTHNLTDSFEKEPYQVIGRMDLWHQNPPLVFDRRSGEREAELVNRIIGKKKKVILCALGGTTSPFPFQELAMGLLKLRFKDHLIVDLSQIKAERIYDLLGLMDKAVCLVAADSAPLHLARASNVPVCALINDKPILASGSVWRPNHIFHCRYSDFPHRAMEMLDAIIGIHDYGSWFLPRLLTPRIVHVWSCYEVTEQNRARHEDARNFWSAAYDNGHWISCPIEVGAFGRDSKHSSIKDTKRYPFLKDVINAACQRAYDEDVICLTRCDTCFASDLTEKLLGEPLPKWAHRRIESNGISFHPSVDLFAFTKAWWKEHAHEVPDLILGIDYQWHQILLDILKKHGGTEIKDVIYRLPGPHSAKPEPAAPRVVYNERLATKWRNGNGKFVLFPAVAKQLETVVINRHALHPFGYNPSVADWQGRTFMSYRYHGDTLATKLAMAELDAKFNVVMNRPIEIQGNTSQEDGRLFIKDGQLWICWVDSTWPSAPPKAVVRYGRLIEDGRKWRVDQVDQPQIGKNDGSAIEKNFVPWPNGSEMRFIYSSYPKQIIYGKQTWDRDGMRWSWGEPRGGTTPIPYKGKLLRFFHSSLNNEPSHWIRRYYIGALILEPEPPFAPVAISKEPILKGSEESDLTQTEKSSCLQWKPKVCFIAGLLQREGCWWLSVGTNDSSCVLVRITEKDLHL